MQLRAQNSRLNELLGSRLRDMSMTQTRELLLIAGPVIAMVAAAIWFALQFVQPEPPKRITIATGGASGAYYGFGQKYAGLLKRHGIMLEVKATAGSLDNAKLLADPDSGVSVALMQGGIANGADMPNVSSLGRLFIEPLWIFYRSDRRLDRLHELRGKRIAVGPEGSGTRKLAMSLLGANGIGDTNSGLQPITGNAAVDAFLSGSVDAVFLAFAPEAPAIRKLLDAPGVRLMSLAQGEAYTRRFPYLQRIVLPQGAFDLVRNVPEEDTTLVAPVAALVARDDLHPALVGLLVEAIKEVHSSGGLFHRTGEFPKPLDPEYDMSADAIVYYKAGPSFLKRLLPFWLATFIERMSVLAVPLVGAMLPILKLGPILYRWRVRRRLLHWYGRLKAVEASLASEPAGTDLDFYRDEVARIEDAVGHLPVPIGFADQYYSLRSAIDLVRQRLGSRSVLGVPQLT